MAYNPKYYQMFKTQSILQNSDLEKTHTQVLISWSLITGGVAFYTALISRWMKLLHCLVGTRTHVHTATSPFQERHLQWCSRPEPLREAAV